MIKEKGQRVRERTLREQEIYDQVINRLIDGENPAKVANEYLEIPRQSLYNWLYKARKAQKREEKEREEEKRKNEISNEISVDSREISLDRSLGVERSLTSSTLLDVEQARKQLISRLRYQIDLGQTKKSYSNGQQDIELGAGELAVMSATLKTLALLDPSQLKPTTHLHLHSHGGSIPDKPVNTNIIDVTNTKEGEKIEQ